MLIQYSPVVGEEKIEYKFNGEKIQVGNLIYDLSSVERNKRYILPYPLVDVYRGEELEVTLIQYHEPDASEEERYPKPFKAKDSELDSSLAVKQLEVIEEEETEESLHLPTTEERIESLEMAILAMSMGEV